MKYKWLISIILKNGQKIYGKYIGDEVNSDLVCNKLFVGAPNDFYVITALEGNGVLLFKRGEVVAATVYAGGYDDEL